MADPWIVPILHGYIHIDTVPVELEGFQDLAKPLTLMVISRRSRYRAGTRYKRRGMLKDTSLAWQQESFTHFCRAFSQCCFRPLNYYGQFEIIYSSY